MFRHFDKYFQIKNLSSLKIEDIGKYVFVIYDDPNKILKNIYDLCNMSMVQNISLIRYLIGFIAKNPTSMSAICPVNIQNRTDTSVCRPDSNFIQSVFVLV